MNKSQSNEKTYVKSVKNRKGEWEEDSTCRINAEQAAMFNTHTKNTGVKYELQTEAPDNRSNVEGVKVGEHSYEPKVVLGAINDASFEGVSKINAATGVVKVQAAFDALTDEQKEAVQSAIELN